MLVLRFSIIYEFYTWFWSVALVHKWLMVFYFFLSFSLSVCLCLCTRKLYYIVTLYSYHFDCYYYHCDSFSVYCTYLLFFTHVCTENTCLYWRATIYFIGCISRFHAIYVCLILILCTINSYWGWNRNLLQRTWNLSRLINMLRQQLLFFNC